MSVRPNEIHRGHAISVHLVNGRRLFISTCPYRGGAGITSARSLFDARAAINEHLRGSFVLRSARYSGSLPCCPGGAPSGPTLVFNRDAVLRAR